MTKTKENGNLKGNQMEIKGFICGPRRGRWSKPKPIKGSKEYKEGKLPKKLRCDNDHILHGRRLWYPTEDCFYVTWELTEEEFDKALEEGDLFSLDMPSMILCPDCAKYFEQEYLKRSKQCQKKK